MKFILESWAPSTRKQYNSSLKTWESYCEDKRLDPLSPGYDTLANFLSSLAIQGKSYSSVASIRAAVCTFWEQLPEASPPTHSQSQIVNRVMKGIFRSNAPVPKYSKVWDVSEVVQGIRLMGPNRFLDLDALTRKTACLLSICSPQRVSELASLDLANMQAKREKISFVLPMTKNRRMGEAHTVTYMAYTDHLLCPVRTLTDYIERTKENRGDLSKVFITTRKPFREVASPTVARWIKDLLRVCGIDGAFGAHSTRAASTSKAADTGVPLKAILGAANWSPNACVFQKFYHKPIDSRTVQDAVLEYAFPFISG